jgi:uncharacterized protein (TIGR02444 family)
MSPGADSARFWDFSVKVYAAEGVKPACLAIQAGGMDVNLALWIAWVAAAGRDPRPALGRALEISALWSARVVTPLRAARDSLKRAPSFVDPAGAGGLRKSVLAAELEAERLEQAALEPLGRLCPMARGDAPARVCAAALADYGARISARAETDGFVAAVFAAAETV